MRTEKVNIPGGFTVEPGGMIINIPTFQSSIVRLMADRLCMTEGELIDRAIYLLSELTGDGRYNTDEVFVDLSKGVRHCLSTLLYGQTLRDMADPGCEDEED